jgi:hypothetical protein
MSTPNTGLILHLNFDDVADGKVTDLSGEGNHGTLQGGPQLVPDDTFGSCLSFDGVDDYVTLPPAAAATDFSRGLSFEAWVFYTAFNPWSRIFDFNNKQDTDNLTLGNEGSTGNLLMRVYRGPSAAEVRDGTLAAGEWLHLAGTLDQAGTARLYVNGQPAGVATIPPVARIPRRFAYIGRGSTRPQDSFFRGKIASARVYNRALSADEIRRDMADDQTAAASFRASYPLNFRLYDREDNQQVIYITDHPQGREMGFEVSNSSRKAITLAAPSAPQVSAENHHFELRLRAGTLSADALGRLALADSGWSLLKPTSAQAAAGDGGVSLYFLSASERTLNPSDKLTLRLSGVAADPGAGARGTRAELRLRQMNYPGDSTPLTGARIQHLNVVNQRGQKSIPLHVGFLDSNTVLNDGASQNQLRLRLTNVSKNALALTPTPSAAATKLVITFDTRGDTEQGKDWALGTASQVNAIQITVPNWTVQKPVAQTPEWVLTTTKTSVTPGEAVELALAGIVTSLPSGMTNLYLRYENIPGHWDGQFVAVIEKAPIVYRGDKVGVGSAAPKAKLQVAGGAIMPAHGSSEQAGILFPKDPAAGLGDAAWLRYYVRQGEATTLELGTSNDPDDHIALMASGNVGVGTNAPQQKLHVDGSSEILSTGAGAGYKFRDRGAAAPNDWVWYSANNLARFHRVNVGDLLSVTTSGSVGIGTNAPEGRLHIVNAGNWPLRVESPSPVGTWIGLKNTSAGGDTWNIISTGAQNGEGTGGLLFKQGDSGPARMLIDRKGKVTIFGPLASQTKLFVIDHPTRPGMKLAHSCLEGPEIGVYYRGTGRLTDGEATVTLPHYFEALTLKQDRTVTLTAKGREPFLLSFEDIHEGSFKVYGTKPDGEFCWEVKAVRADVEALEVEVRK